MKNTPPGLKDFLKNNFGLDWIKDDTTLKKEIDLETHKEYIEINDCEVESVRIYLTDDSNSMQD